MQPSNFVWTDLGEDSKQCLTQVEGVGNIHLEANLKNWTIYQYIGEDKKTIATQRAKRSLIPGAPAQRLKSNIDSAETHFYRHFPVADEAPLTGNTPSATTSSQVRLKTTTSLGGLKHIDRRSELYVLFEVFLSLPFVIFWWMGVVDIFNTITALFLTRALLDFVVWRFYVTRRVVKFAVGLVFGSLVR